MVKIIVWNPTSITCGHIRTLEKYSRKLEVINRHSKQQKLIIFPKDDNKSLRNLKRILSFRQTNIGLKYKILTNEGKEIKPEESKKRLNDFKKLRKKRKVKPHKRELTTNEKLIKQFLEHKEYSKRTKKDYRLILIHFAKTYNLSLNNITIWNILNHLRQLKKKGLSKSTIINHRKILSYFLLWKIKMVIKNHINSFLDKYKTKIIIQN